ALMAYSSTVTLLPWEYLWIGFDRRAFPDLFDPVWIGSPVRLGAPDIVVAPVGARDRVHAANAGAPPAPPLPRHVGVGLLVGADHVLPADRGLDLPVRLRRDTRDHDRGTGHDGLVALPEVSAPVRGIRAPARPPALPRAGPAIRARGDDPHEA